MTDIDLNKEKLTTAEAAAYMSTPERPISVQNLANMRYQGIGPRFSKPTPNRVVYFKNDIDEWYEKNKHTSTKEYAR